MRHPCFRPVYYECGNIAIQKSWAAGRASMQFATLRESSAISILLPLAALASFVTSTTFAALPDTTYESGFETCPTPAQYCADVDQDNYGDSGYCFTTCEKPYDFFALPPTDCDNDSALTNPGATEICDGIDNNCDGNIDEGNPGGGAVCDTGQLGMCAAGTVTCASGALTRKPNASGC